MASRAISVKVATAKVIKSLEEKLAEVEKNYVNQEANEAKYQKEYEKYRKALTDYAIANIKKATNFRTNYRSYQNNLNIDFDIQVLEKDLPIEPKREFEVMAEWSYKEIREEVSNAIRILKMTDEETVNASTFKSIAKYL